MRHFTGRLARVAGTTLTLVLAACAGTPVGTTSAAPINVALDSAFGTNGIMTVSISANTHDRFIAVTVAPDGKVYATGFVIENGDQSMVLARFETNGTVDKTFGTNGVATVNVAVGGKVAEVARGVVVQSSGKIVIAGPVEHDAKATGDAARDTDIAVVRFDTTGKLDTTFGTAGIARIDLGAGRITTGTTFVGDSSWGIANLTGDKLVVFGSALADGAGRTDSDYVAVGLTSTGALDTAFGTGGKLVVDIDKSGDNARTIVVLPDGKLVATGYSAAASDGVVSPVIIRFSAAGVLDTTFGKGGVATTRVLPGVTESYAVGVQGDNYISAGYGRGASTTEKVDLVVERFKGTDGSWDKTFATEGLYRLDIAKEDDRARNLTVLPDGKIIIVGSGKKTALDVDGMIVLLEKDGAPVKSFGEDGHLISNLGGTADAWFGVALSPDKTTVWVAGYKGTEGSGNDDAVIARLKLN